ncbi:glycosyltransferase family 4 protein [Oryzobacter terrae]|uniref:glycosyltransferase family 4 protein n=1 Tax=Oryzobacter terrae TaxID=1620385 RepID=UPI003670ADEA
MGGGPSRRTAGRRTAGRRPAGARPLVLYGMTSGVSARGFIRGQAPFLRDRGWDVALLCNEEADVARFAAEEGMRFLPVPLERNPSWRSDLRAVRSLVGWLRGVRPSVAVWGTPKASLFGVAACRVLGVPTVYQVHGLRLEGASGVRRRVLAALESLTCRLATVVVPVGHELRESVAALSIVPANRVRLLADGSCNGVAPSTGSPRYREALGIAPSATVVTFAGRITRDKGLRELATAWERITGTHPDAHLVVAGRVDGPDPAGPELAARLGSLPHVHLVGHVDDLENLWADTDVCVLPSYREGLPLVVIEAATAGVPAVVTDCTGGREVVEPGRTGLVVPRRDAEALGRALAVLLDDVGLRHEMGERARVRALARYDRDRLWGELDALLREVARP